MGQFHFSPQIAFFNVVWVQETYRNTIQNHMELRIIAEKDDLVTSNLLFLASVVCEQRGGCSQNRSLIEEMRKKCDQTTNPGVRESACGEVDKIENRKL